MMNNFTDFIKESRKYYDSESLLSSEVAQYVRKVNKVIPSIVKDAIYLTQKYNLMDAASLEDIKNSSKGNLKKLSDKYNIPENEIEDFWKLLKDLKNNIKLLPQYQSKIEREMIELGKLSKDDLTIDLETQQGRNAAAKIYMPLVYKIVNQYVGKSNLSRQELISAGLQGLTSAMNDWGKNKDDKKVAFKTYAGFRVKQQILNDINNYSHSLTGFNDYAIKQGWSADAISLDGLLNVDDDFKQDRLKHLGISDDKNPDKESAWKPIYKLIENNFKERDVNIFYRVMGLNGYKKEKSKDVAKEMGWSDSNIRNSVLNKIINFLRKDKRAIEILSEIQDLYNESLMLELWNMDKDMVIESLLNDDLFILLEELNRWNNKDMFKSMLNNALKSLDDNEKNYILSVLDNNFEFLDSTFKKNKKTILIFLSNMYISEPINKKTDVALLEMMEDIQNAYKKHIVK